MLKKILKFALPLALIGIAIKLWLEWQKRKNASAAVQLAEAKTGEALKEVEVEKAKLAEANVAIDARIEKIKEAKSWDDLEALL